MGEQGDQKLESNEYLHSRVDKYRRCQLEGGVLVRDREQKG